jgi:hypothetical protein
MGCWVFISHAAIDQPLAEHLRAALLRGSPGPDSRVFLSSRAGQIESGEVFFESILEELAEAERVLVLLTPNSSTKPWVMFV